MVTVGPLYMGATGDGRETLTVDVTISDEKLWWHAFGGVATSGAWKDCWALTVLGESTIPPGGKSADGTVLDENVVLKGCLRYLTSWDHEPTEAEKDAITPPEFLLDNEDSDV